MSKLTRRTVFLAKTETTYAASGDTPVATDAVLANTGLTLTVTGEKIERNTIRDSLSPLGHVIGSKSVSIEVEVEAKGGGLDDDELNAPEFDCLLKACALASRAVTILPVADSAGFAAGDAVSAGAASGTVAAVTPEAVIVAVTSGTFAEGATLTGVDLASEVISAAPYPGLEYRPVSNPTAMKSAVVWFYRDGILHKVRGLRGSVALNCEVGKIPTLKFSFKGLFTAPEDATLPVPVLSAITPPICNGLGLLVGNYTPVANKLALDLKNNLAELKDISAPDGLIEVIITSRAPSGSLDPEAAALSDWNPWTAWRNATPAAITARIGSTPGNRLTVVAPKALYDEVKYGDRDGLVTYDLPFTCVGTSDDELSLIFS